MFVPSIWCVLCVFGCVSTSLNKVEYDMNCAENYDNEIPLDQQEDFHPKTPAVGLCQDYTSRWDKLFTVLEDSHMRQNMLLSSVEQSCGGGPTPLKMLVDKLGKGGCHLCVSNMEKICKTHAEQTNLKLNQALVDIMNYNTEMERNLNLTLQQILHQTHKTNARLKKLEDDQRILPRPTMMPRGFGTATTLSSSGFKEQEAENQSLDKGSIGKALVAIAAELQKVHVQLNKVIEETRRKDRGDT